MSYWSRDDDEVHERFSYPKNPCLIEIPGHECDLPKEHLSRHMCGMCGMMFGELEF